MEQKLIFTNLVGTAIDDLAADLQSPDTVVIADVNTEKFVYPILVNDSATVAAARLITVKAGDANKNLDELANLWRNLGDAKATRSTLVINLGGGVVTDLGAFAASTFKRGMRFINVPTTLLGAADASFGGKNGINFNGLKNQIGTFSEPEATIISTCYFNTLPQQEILSGYAEMLKHGLLENKEMMARLLQYSPVYPVFDSQALLGLLQESVAVKTRIVASDFTETGLRKALNLGHTFAHAFEEMAFSRSTPIAHGFAVAWGLVCSLVLSHMILGFPSDFVHTFADYILKNYGAFDITCNDYPTLLSLMKNDKKNLTSDQVAFTLLREIGQPEINQTVGDVNITAALDIYRDLMHLA